MNRPNNPSAAPALGSRQSSRSRLENYFCPSLQVPVTEVWGRGRAGERCHKIIPQKGHEEEIMEERTRTERPSKMPLLYLKRASVV